MRGLVNFPISKIIIALVVAMAIVLGIGFAQGIQDTTPSPPAASSEAMPAPNQPVVPPPSPKVIWVLWGLNYEITEKTPGWWKFSWQATLKNNTTSTVDFFIYVKFLDQEGFVVDDDIVNPPVFESGEQRDIRGFALIDIDIAPNVYNIESDTTAYIQD